MKGEICVNGGDCGSCGYGAIKEKGRERLADEWTGAVDWRRQ